jgi:hypothetical protein
MRAQKAQGVALAGEVVIDALEHERAAMLGLPLAQFFVRQPQRAQDALVEAAAGFVRA